MTFKFSEGQITEYETHEAKAQELISEVERAVQAYNDGLEELKLKVEEALVSYNEGITEIHEWLGETISDFQSEFDDKSERWQEGNKGSAVTEWIDRLQTLCNSFESFDLDFPDAIDVDLPSFDETIPYEPDL